MMETIGDGNDNDHHYHHGVKTNIIKHLQNNPIRHDECNNITIIYIIYHIHHHD